MKNISNRMIKSIVFITLLLNSAVLFAISLQQDEDAEVVEVINDSSESDMYGSWLFNGGFSDVSFSGINPDYRIASGDKLLVQLWGGIEYQQEIIVDPKGNFFIPKVGPITVLGVSNQNLNLIVLKSVKRVYKSNVEVYVTLLSTQKVKVFLTGLVNKPGLYEGQSADSILRFIDQAKGIRADIGGLRQVQLRRNNKTIETIDLYDFLSSGAMPRLPLQDGDVIFVGPRQGVVTVEGEVGFAGKYEIRGRQESIANILNAIVPNDKATNVTIIEAINKNVEASQYSLSDIDNQMVSNGALIKLSSQLRPNSISVEVVGEHNSDNELVVAWGTSLKSVIKKIKLTKLSNLKGIQLYRKSVAERQKDMLQASLTALEQSVLTARSSTREEAQLRKAEAEIMLQWIEKARSVEPKGQVILSRGYEADKIILQQGDRIVIPSNKNLVMIHGEVLFPTAIAFNGELTIDDFIAKAGGTNRGSSDFNIVIMRPNGEFINANSDLDEEGYVKPGDEIFVLAEPDSKSLQLTKDLSQIIYQIAVSAAVVIAL
ncbi:MAG: protein involved in polysaccharide export with SLBB domain [Moritella dasanensis]|jgi:protein involved in polysaccharide export with SLBB domain